MKDHITEDDRHAFESSKWGWKATRQGFMLRLPGPTFVYVIPGSLANAWSTYEATVTGLHILVENHTLGSARGIAEMVALATVLARRKARLER